MLCLSDILLAHRWDYWMSLVLRNSKLMVLNNCASTLQMSSLRISTTNRSLFGNRPKTLSTLLSLLFTSKFSSAHQFKNHIELLSTFFDESHRKPNAKSENKRDKQPLFVISIVNVLSPLVSWKFSQMSTIHLGIFRGWTLWAYSVSPWINT